MPVNDDLLRVATLVSKEGPVFQQHVTDLVRDLNAKEFTLRHEPEIHEAIADFRRVELGGLPIEPSASAWMEFLLLDLEAGTEHLGAEEVLDAVIGEIIHRRKWDAVMKKYPNTLNVLKSRIMDVPSPLDDSPED